ncbi:phosphoenolpyruvate carboxylase kinase 1-like [Rhododendron vialii]|uniref:phosphoenolpyruvate carboxylase kinase 1-like n=1 Tax=Rhododendron vialii TaxID=182163 RepID=UPI00265FA176|nr:phosphoenolpyruvate carboxylase kinase 1-like [Rhododendron vialii]
MCESLKREYKLCEEIGRGRFGVVYRCFSAVSGDSFACKSIDKRLLTDAVDRECVEKEPKILQLLSDHPNILQLYQVFDDENYLHIITDLCSSADLFHRLNTSAPLPEPSAASILHSLISAIAYCHRLGISHRDIKPDNILFDSHNELKLADFGSADMFREGAAPMSGVVGTPYYVAPEVLSGGDYNEKVDVWSAGVVLYVMLSGFVPFCGETAEETFEAVVRGNLRFPTRVFRAVSNEAKDLLRKMICKDASRRLSAEQVLRHPWIINGGETRSMTDMT